MGQLMRGRRLLATVVLGAMALGAALAPATALAADGISFSAPTATPTYGQGIDFSVTVDLRVPVDRAELLLRFPDTPGPLVVGVPAPTGTGKVVLHYSFSVADQGHLLPNTTIESSWRLRATGGDTTVTSQPVTVTYADDSYDWKTIAGQIMKVHWVEGDQAFGERALAIGEAGIEKAEQLFGVTETEPIDFFVYPDQQRFYDALGPGTRENVGGQANADIRTLFALITPAEIDDAWVGVVIPHELTHLVFNTAVKNPYHFPPRWLNEGLAVYLSEGYKDSDRRAVLVAAQADRLMPLAGLTGQFPTTQAGFFLAYSESVSAVEFMVRTYGQDAVVSLVKSYAEGRTDDEAFTAALGIDTTAFDAAWFKDVNGTIPDRVGPQPDPAGPVPAEWAAAPSGAPVASPVASAPSTSPIPQGGDTSTGPFTLLGIALLGIAAAGVAVWLIRGRRRRGPPAAVTVPEDEPSQHGP